MSGRQFNLADLFEVVADTVPDRLALVAGEARLTYRALDERANQVGHLLEASGLVAGTHAGILARNRHEWVEAMIGCYKARIVPVNLNYRYVAPELRYVVDNADLELLFYEDELTPLVDAALTDAGDAGDAGDADDAATGPLNAQLHRVIIGSKDPPTGVADGGDAGYETAIDAASPARTFGPRSPDDLYILYTGGTTGMPKGVMWRQEDIFFAAMGGGGWGSTPITTPDELADRINPDDTGRVAMLVAGPLMHGNAQWAMWNAFMMGGTAVLYTEHRYDPDVVLKLVEAEQVMSVALVGDAMARPIAEALENAPPGTYDTSSVAVVGSGGAMLSATVKAELKAQLPSVVVMDRFGSSESGAQGAVDEGASGPRFSMGPDTSVLDDDLRPLAPGDGRTGRLARSGRMPLGYYKDPVKTAATFPTDANGVRWSVPGDLATVEADGTITVFGRGSASINSGGEKIFPEEVEAAVKSHPDVFDAIVVGVPDERFGERVAVVVQLRGVSRMLHLDDLQEHCRGRIAGYKIPRELVVTDKIPLTAAGKPDTKAAKALL